MKVKDFIGVILVPVIVFGLVVPGFSMYVGNYSGSSFEESDPATDPTTMSRTTSVTLSVEDLVIKSASYFLKGNAQVYLLSSKLEAAEQDGVCYYEYQMIVNEALDHMRMARYYYRMLKDKADCTPYNQQVIEKLTAFDYKSLANDYGLNAGIFDQVVSYLEAGDVRGVYGRFLVYIDNIITKLESVQKDVYCWKFPTIDTIWNLNQECADMLLFGQYVARVFYKIA